MVPELLKHLVHRPPRPTPLTSSKSGKPFDHAGARHRQLGASRPLGMLARTARGSDRETQGRSSRDPVDGAHSSHGHAPTLFATLGSTARLPPILDRPKVRKGFEAVRP
jgi:hypothetical protein